MLVQLFIHEGRLDQRLAVVEDTVDLNGCDVLAQCGKLALLNGADLALGVEHIDMDALHAEETVGYGRTCIAAGGYQHVDLLFLSLSLNKVLEQASHEACTDILEGEGRTVEELQGIDVVLYLDDRAVEGQRVEDQVLQRIFIDILAKEVAGHVIGNVLERHALHVVEECLGQFVYFFRHIETAVFCQSFHYGLLQIGQWCFTVCAVIFHKLINVFMNSSSFSKPNEPLTQDTSSYCCTQSASMPRCQMRKGTG